VLDSVEEVGTLVGRFFRGSLAGRKIEGVS